MRTGFMNVASWLATDEPERARKESREALALWPHRGFQQQHMWGMVAETEALLYQQDGAGALAHLAAAWPSLRRSLLLRMQFFFVVAHALQARAALVAAGQASPAKRRPLLVLARRSARKLAGLFYGHSRSLAALLRAGANRLDGGDDRVRLELEQAVSGFDQAELAMHAPAARFRLGQCVGGDVGAQQCRETEAWFRNQGVQRPDRFIAMLAPMPGDP